MKKLRILVDCSELNMRNIGGVRTYAIEITKAFMNNDSIECSLFVKYSDRHHLSQEGIDISNQRVFYSKKNNLFIKSIMRTLIIFGAHKNYLKIKTKLSHKNFTNPSFDFIYTPTTYLNYKFTGIKSIVTLHDIQERDLPENFTYFERKYREFRTRITLDNSTVIHVSSHFIKSTIEQHYPNEFEKLKCIVIPEGISGDRVKNYNRVKQRQILFPARPWKHKNHEVLFEALKYLTLENPMRFILTGSNKTDFKKVPSIKESNIEFKGIVSKFEMDELYNKSFAVLSCSLYESSSLPLLEGIAAGCLILASNIDAHKEMAEVFDFTMFDPKNAKSLADGIMNLSYIYDSNQHIKERKFEIIRDRNWSSTCDKLVLEMKSACLD
jgi:glycosyltransferase involved in cell wall biosynthesis